MSSTPVLFEVSWEVAHKVGGLHSVLASKARTAVERHGDDYLLVGPLRISGDDRQVPLDDDADMDGFVTACRELGLTVRAGRWRVPGRPRCLLIDFSSLYDRKDDLLAKLWEEFEVDSLEGGWDYVEPLLFGHAAALVIEEYWRRELAPAHRHTTVIAHEWTAGAALLQLSKTPAIGTVFVAHSTVVGRALSADGTSLEISLGEAQEFDGDAAARDHGVLAKHSLEGRIVTIADQFAAVSPVIAHEVSRLHGRAANALLPNGIDLESIDEIAQLPEGRTESRAALLNFAHRFFGTPVDDAMLLCLAGRYEFHNKGIDIALEALARLDQEEGRPIVLFLFVPTGSSGMRREVLDRLRGEAPTGTQDPIGLTTHHLFEEENDPIRTRCEELGLHNQTGARVKVVHIPTYLLPGDGLFDRHYEGALSAVDLGVFPSFYDPWGSAPQESLAMGVPAITTDFAGFARTATDQGVGSDDGLFVLKRRDSNHETVVDELAALLRARTEQPVDDALRARARAAVECTAWSQQLGPWDEVLASTLDAVKARAGMSQAPAPRRPIVKLAPEAGSAPRLVEFDVAATLPKALAGLDRCSRNFYWCWDRDLPALFAELDPEAWERSHHNPIVAIRQADPERVESLANGKSYLARVDGAVKRFDRYMAERRPQMDLQDGATITQERPIAYFCAEYGLHESFPIYSGGLGVLAGDHLKSASDLNLPFVAVGLYYRFGYMKQELTSDGQQIAVDLENLPADLPVEPLRRPDGSTVEIRVPFPGRDVVLRAFLCEVGRTRLYLLCSNHPANQPEDREITRNLYGGDHETRIRQLIVLGRGGVRLLEEIGVEPSAWHMNEGHAAFLTLERVSRLLKGRGLTFEAAREWVRATTAFTTHTPVPAGHDRFGEDLVRRYFSDVESWLGVPWERFLRLGRAEMGADDVNMTYLALSFSSVANGVSQMHGDVSRELLHEYWPSLLEAEVPVDAVTNGIHLRTWTAERIQKLFRTDDEAVLGADFRDRARSIDPAELWAARKELKGVLAEKIEERLRRAFVARNDSPLLLNKMLQGVDENALWIGFARRFAPYKRAGLLYSDVQRLRALCDSTDRPIRIFVAGKAHPRDVRGQEILKGIAQLARGDELIGRVTFLEDYDMDLARALVQGVDVWLNNPTRGLEASGTSGMKVSANGGLNLSIADGWWPEAADGTNGWTIGQEKVYEDQELQDQLDGTTIYRMLEEDLGPLYFDRDAKGVPQGWIEFILRNFETVPPMFDTDRMVQEYFDLAYAPLAVGDHSMLSDAARAQQVTDQAQRIRRGFGNIRILEVRMPEMSALQVGERIDVVVRAELGELSPEDLEVELVLGLRGAHGEPIDAQQIALEAQTPSEGSVFTFAGEHRLERSGRYVQGLRIRPRRLSASPSSLRDLALWA